MKSMLFTLSFVGFGCGMLLYVMFGFLSVAVGYDKHEPDVRIAVVFGVLGYVAMYFGLPAITGIYP
jgi:hypothetical protein